MVTSVDSSSASTRDGHLCDQALTPSFESIHIVSDIDGTVNNESLPESCRIGSVAAARDAFAEVMSDHVECSLISSRTVSECYLYREALGLNGYIIAEDGGVIQLPTGVSSTAVNALEKSGYRVQPFAGGYSVVLSRVSVAEIRELLLQVASETGTPVTSSVTSTAAELQKAAGHSSVQLAEASMMRLASAYAKDLTDVQATVLTARAASLGIRVLHSPWDRIHQMFGMTRDGVPADKGNALRALLDISKIIGQRQNVRPLVIGNSSNDISLFNTALELGGAAVLIPAMDGSFRLDLSALPQNVHRATRGAGEGIKETLGMALRELGVSS